MRFVFASINGDANIAKAIAAAGNWIKAFAAHDRRLPQSIKMPSLRFVSEKLFEAIVKGLHYRPE